MDEIAIYADGSFYDEIGLGSWAFRVPALGLAGSGAELGASSMYFEMLAAVRGIECAAARDGLKPLRVHTDCKPLLDRIAQLCVGTFTNPQTYEQKLLPVLQRIVASRPVLGAKCNGTSAEHLLCHTEAGRVLREALAENTCFARKVAYVRQKARLQQLVKQRTSLGVHLGRLDEQIALLRAEVESLAEAEPVLVGPELVGGAGI